MKRKNLFLTINLILCAVMFFSGSMAVYTASAATSTADAVENVELRDDCSLDITYSASDVTVVGEEIKLWHIADITADAEYTLAGSFKSYPITVTGTSSQTEWNEMTVTLNSYILADGILPDYTAKTDENGKVSFKNLTAGIYLVGSVRTEKDEKNYIYESFLAAVPGIDADGKWIYSVSAKPKVSENTPPRGGVNYKAVKIWKDNGKNRPDSVNIEIYKDGILHESVRLSAENDWMYTWTTVDANSVWSVVEKNVPDGYKVGIQKNGNTFNITNSKQYPGEDVPKTGDTTGTTLWLLLAAAAGMALVAAGITQRKKYREE